MADIPLFEQPQETTPGNLSDRLAYGRVGVDSKNITWTNLVAWLGSVLSFLKPSNNLSDVDDLATARTNLDVYDTTTIDDALFLKADKTNVLEKDNTTTFVPSSDYNPSTKKYTDEGGASTGWLEATAETGPDSATFTVKVQQRGAMVVGTGQVKLDSISGSVAFTLPPEVGTASIDVYFGASDASSGDNTEYMIQANTHDVYIVNGSTGNIQSFNFCYPVG